MVPPTQKGEPRAEGAITVQYFSKPPELSPEPSRALVIYPGAQCP